VNLAAFAVDSVIKAAAPTRHSPACHRLFGVPRTDDRPTADGHRIILQYHSGHGTNPAIVMGRSILTLANLVTILDTAKGKSMGSLDCQLSPEEDTDRDYD